MAKKQPTGQLTAHANGAPQRTVGQQKVMELLMSPSAGGLELSAVAVALSATGEDPAAVLHALEAGSYAYRAGTTVYATRDAGGKFVWISGQPALLPQQQPQLPPQPPPATQLQQAHPGQQQQQWQSPSTPATSAPGTGTGAAVNPPTTATDDGEEGTAPWDDSSFQDAVVERLDTIAELLRQLIGAQPPARAASSSAPPWPLPSQPGEPVSPPPPPATGPTPYQAGMPPFPPPGIPQQQFPTYQPALPPPQQPQYGAPPSFSAPPQQPSYQPPAYPQQQFQQPQPQPSYQQPWQPPSGPPPGWTPGR